MNIPQYYLIFAVVLVSSLSANPIQPEIPDESGAPGDVVFVNVLYRHGDRTPIDPYPTDPYNDPKFWPVGWGQLTKVGMRQHYELGKWLRNRYRTLLVNDYSRDDIYIQSTDVDRTLMSAMSHLSGMYPPTASRQFDENIQWAPIPVHTVPEHQDNILAMKKKCPQYEDQLEKIKSQDPKLKSLTEKWQDIFAYLTEHVGRLVHDIRSAEYVYNNLFIEDANNLTLPEWTKKVYPQPLREIASVSFMIPTFTNELARLKAGPLVGQMLENLHSKIKKEMNPDRKMFMYSAHDTTVANVLNALRVFTPSSPPYTAMILMELWKKGEDYFVAVSYKNSSAEPTLLTIPGCSEYCPIQKFDALVRPIIPEDWEKECINDSILEDFNNLTIIAMVVCFVALIALVVMACFQRRSDRDSYFRYHTVSTNIN